jgi:hypothetical protein
VPTRGKLPFDKKSIGENVDAARIHLEIEVDDIWEKVGLSSRTHWYAKVAGDKPFKWEEVARFCLETHAPKGFPILTWHEALAYERYLENSSGK